MHASLWLHTHKVALLLVEDTWLLGKNVNLQSTVCNTMLYMHGHYQRPEISKYICSDF